MTALPQTATFGVDVHDEQVASFHENRYLAFERIMTDELPTAPVAQHSPRDRPWIDEGQKAVAAREVCQSS